MMIVSDILYRHQPKGSMCCSCSLNKSDCSELTFNKMPVIDKYKDGDDIVRIVKCTEYVKRGVDNEQP